VPQAPEHGQRIEPERLDFDGFADARSDHVVADLRVHPGELQARSARRQETIGLEADAVARAAGIALYDLLRRSFERRALARRQSGAVRFQQLPDAEHVPERCVDRVVLRRLRWVVREAVGQHALGDCARPGQQDLRCLVIPLGRQAEPAQRNERVAPPIAEPRVACDDRLPRTSTH
jgi:hypothetical protein